MKTTAKTARHILAIIAAVCVMFTYSFTAADEVHAASSTQKQADPIEVGSEAEGELNAGGSADHYYKFNTDGEGGTYVIDTSLESGSADLYIYNSSFEPVGGCTLAAGGDTKGVALAGLDPNSEYFVEVSAAGASVHYLISVTNAEDVITTCNDDDEVYEWIWPDGEEDDEWEEDGDEADDEDSDWDEDGDEEYEWTWPDGEDGDNGDDGDVDWDDSDDSDDGDVDWDDSDDSDDGDIDWDDSDDGDVDWDDSDNNDDNDDGIIVWDDSDDGDVEWEDEDDSNVDDNDSDSDREVEEPEDNSNTRRIFIPRIVEPEETDDPEEEEKVTAPADGDDEEAAVNEPEPEKKPAANENKDNKDNKDNKGKKNTKKSKPSKKNKKSSKNGSSSKSGSESSEPEIYNYYPSGSDSSDNSWNTEDEDVDTEDELTEKVAEVPDPVQEKKEPVDNSKKLFEGSVYELNANGTATLVRAANKNDVTIPATIMDKKGRTYTVTGIGEGAFKNSKATTITIKTRDLTSESVKGCLAGSNVSTVKVRARIIILNLKYKWSYKKFFKEENSGKTIKIK